MKSARKVFQTRDVCGLCLSSDLLYRSRAREQSGQKDAVLTAGACMFSNVYVLDTLSHSHSGALSFADMGGGRESIVF